MHIAVLGLNHETAPIELRERLTFKEEELPRALAALRQEFQIQEAVILSTCNRVELYALLPQVDGHRGRLTDFLAHFHRIEAQEIRDRLYWHHEPDSVRHLFRVASGLESMVVGESEILGQVRQAYQKAVSCESVGSVFNRLFQTALKTGKRVRSGTRIGQGAVSVSSVAVELARRIFQSLKVKTVLILGAGTMGEAALNSLEARGVGQILVANRSPEAALRLAEDFAAEAIPWGELDHALVRSDIAICSTASDQYLLNRADAARIMVRRRQRPLFLIDISVPRNLDPAIGGLENVYLYDIDDLEGIACANQKMRVGEMDLCASIIEEELGQFLARWNGQFHAPLSR